MDNEKFEEITENNAAPTDELKAEIPNLTKPKKYITLDETITLQAIICVVISIIFIAANMFMPEIAEELSDSFRENYYLSDEKTENVIETILGFVNSKPVSYD